MKKKLKRWGNNLVITFTKEDESIYGLKEGDIIEVNDSILESKKNVQNIIKKIKK